MIGQLHAAIVASVSRGTDPTRLAQIIRNTNGADAVTRLDVYHDSIRCLHIDTLSRAYPVCREVLGEDYWRQLITNLVGRYGSHSSDLNHYGDFLADALGTAQAEQPELAEFPYLRCLAHLEWRIHIARLARDDDMGDWQQFAELTPEARGACSLRASHALSILQSIYPIDVIWHRHTAPGQPLDNLPGPVYLCIHREGRFGIGVSRLTPRESGIAGAIMSGATVTELERLSEDMHAGHATDMVLEWISRGWITGYSPGAGDA